MGVGDTIIWGLAVGAVVVSLANPGGLIIGAIIAFLLLAARYGLPFVGDLVKRRQSGVGAAKKQQQIQREVREQLRNADPRDDDDRRRRR